MHAAIPSESPRTTEAHDLLTRSRAEQGLPPTVEDDAAVERLAVLLPRLRTGSRRRLNHFSNAFMQASFRGRPYSR